MSTISDQPRIEYAYSYQETPTSVDSDGLVIKLRCPGILSFKWCLKLYSLVLGGLGLLLSFIWVFFHVYVLSQTSLQELRQLRSVILAELVIIKKDSFYCQSEKFNVLKKAKLEFKRYLGVNICEAVSPQY